MKTDSEATEVGVESDTSHEGSSQWSSSSADAGRPVGAKSKTVLDTPRRLRSPQVNVLTTNDEDGDEAVAIDEDRRDGDKAAHIQSA